MTRWGSVPSVGLDGSRVAVLVVSFGRVHCRAGTRIAAEGRGPLGHLGTVSFWIPPGAVSRLLAGCILHWTFTEVRYGANSGTCCRKNHEC